MTGAAAIYVDGFIGSPAVRDVDQLRSYLAQYAMIEPALEHGPSRKRRRAARTAPAPGALLTLKQAAARSAVASGPCASTCARQPSATSTSAAAR